jgi:hypothetical protein
MEMPLEVWQPGMFVLSLLSMGLCLLFMKACKKNLVPVPHDLLNRYSCIAAVYLPIRGSDPARMVLTEPIAAF